MPKKQHLPSVTIKSGACTSTLKKASWNRALDEKGEADRGGHGEQTPQREGPREGEIAAQRLQERTPNVLALIVIILLLLLLFGGLGVLVSPPFFILLLILLVIAAAGGFSRRGHW